MNSSLTRPFFWIISVFLLAVDIFICLVEPVVGIVLLLLLVLSICVLMFFKPGLWAAVRPTPRPNKPLISDQPDHEQPAMVLENCSNGSIIHITKDVFTLGRAKDCDYVFTGAPKISLRHCCITYRGVTRHFYIEDLGSTNGTVVNAQRLDANTPVPLKFNSIVALGQSRYIFKKATK